MSHALRLMYWPSCGRFGRQLMLTRSRGGVASGRIPARSSTRTTSAGGPARAPRRLRPSRPVPPRRWWREAPDGGRFRCAACPAGRPPRARPETGSAAETCPPGRRRKPGEHNRGDGEDQPVRLDRQGEIARDPRRQAHRRPQEPAVPLLAHRLGQGEAQGCVAAQARVPRSWTRPSRCPHCANIEARPPRARGLTSTARLC
jgi:hypothetical protein